MAVWGIRKKGESALDFILPPSFLSPLSKVCHCPHRQLAPSAQPKRKELSVQYQDHVQPARQNTKN